MEMDTIGEDEICLLTDTNQVVLSSDYLTLNRTPYIFTQDSAVTVPVEHTLEEMGSTQYFPMQAFTGVGLVDGQLVPNETTFFLDPSQIMFLTNGTQILKTIQTVPNQELTTTDSDNMYSSAVTADPNFMKVTEFVLPSGDHLVDSIPQQTISVDALSSTDDANYHPLNVTEDGGQLLLESATIEPMEEAVATIQQQDFEQQTIEQPEEHQEREVGGEGGGGEGGEGEVERQGELEAAAQLQPGPEPEQALQPNPISRIWSDIDVSPPLRKGPHFCELCSRKYDSWSVYKKHMKSHLEDKPYRCKKCPATFNVPNNLLLHEATHNTDNLSCPIKDCLKRFNRLASLKAHLNSHQQEESLFCTECGDEFNNQLQLDKHATEHYQEWIKPAAKIHNCIHCGRRYGKESVLKEHMKCHYKMKTSLGARKQKKKKLRGMYLHECETCHKSFQKPSQLIRHKRIHTGEKPFKCDICSRAFNQKGSMKIHKLKHSGARPYQCEFCKAKFSQKGNLRAHVVRLHSIPRNEERVFKCHFCSCVFRKVSRLNAHMNRSHRGENPPETDSNSDGNEANIEAGRKDMSDSFPAKDSSDKENDEGENARQDLDGRAATKQVSSNRRMKVSHVRTVPHACTYCGKEFKKPSDLVRHIRIHTHEKPFKCGLCFRSFTVRSTLTTHLRTHSNEKGRYCCFDCNKLFSSLGSLKVHLKSHMRAKKYLCKHCLEPYATIGERTRHMADVHGVHPETGEHALGDLQLPDVVLPEPLVMTHEGLMEMVAASKLTEDKDRPIKCTLCDTRFNKLSNLKIHMRIHTGERPFNCDLCTRSFITNAVMKAHRKTHFGIKSFGCEECGKHFTTKNTLSRHMQTHTNVGKPFICPYCSKNFKTRNSCKNHIRSHSTIAIAQMFENAGQLQNDDPSQQNFVDNVTNTEEDPGQHEVLNTSIGVESEEKDAVDAMLISQNTYQLADGTEQIINVDGSKTLHTIHAVSDTGETMLIPNIPIQDDLTQESIRVIQESLNNQIFNLTSLDKEQSVNPNALFDQPFDQMVFSAITTLPTDQMSLEQVLPSSTNLRSILADKSHSLEAVNVHIETDNVEEHEVAQHHISEANDSIATLVDGTNIISVVNENGVNETFHLNSSDDQECENGMSETFQLNSSDNNQDCEKPKCEVCDQTFNTQAQLRVHERNHGKRKTHECSLCGATFSTATSLNRHTKVIHTDVKSFGCSECSAAFRTESQLRRHINELHGGGAGGGGGGGGVKRRGGKWRRGEARLLTEEETRGLLNQQAPPGASISEKVLIASVAERGTVSQFKNSNTLTITEVHPNRCKFCPKSFRKPSDLTRHLRIHTGERPFQCHHCYKSFTVKTTLDSHLKTHSDSKQLTCHVCGSKFATKGSLTVHMRLHTGSKPFVCPACGMRFRTSGHRKAHVALHVKDGTMVEATDIYIMPQEEPQHCAAAGSAQAEGGEEEDQQLEVANDENSAELFQMFDHQIPNLGCDDTSPQALILIQSKVNTVVDNKPKAGLVCNICSKEFSKQSVLTRHMRTHTGERPFKCDECGKMFNQKYPVQNHRQKHSAEKPSKCPECEISLTQKGNLKTHLRRLHQFSPHTTALNKQSKVKNVFNLEFDNVIGDIFSTENTGVSVN